MDQLSILRLLAAVLAMPLAVTAQADPLRFGPSVPTVQQIDQYLTAKQSALAGRGEKFVDEGRKYDVDPRLIVAIAGAESTFGKHVCAVNNAWNWFHRRTCPPSTFDHYSEGIERVTKFMRKSYFNRGYTTIPAVRQKYCAAGCDNWIPLVTRFHAEMPENDAQPPVSVTPPAIPQKKAQQQAQTAPAPLAGRVMGIPVGLLFFAGAAIVALWMRPLLRR